MEYHNTIKTNYMKMRKMYCFHPRVCSLLVLLMGFVVGLQAATITYKLTTHTDGREITGSAQVPAGESLNNYMPQALWRAYCTYTYYSDVDKTQVIENAPSSDATVYVDYEFDPPFILSEEGKDPVWHYLRTYNSGGTNNYLVIYDQDAENEWGNPKQTIKSWKSVNGATPKAGSNYPIAKAGHDQWAFYGDAYDFHIRLNDATITNNYMIWNSTTRNDTPMGLGAKKPVGWQLYVNTATNSKISGTMAMGPYDSTNYLANLENVNSFIYTDGLDTSKQYFDSHNQLVYKSGSSSQNTTNRNNLWWYALFATPVTSPANSTDIWRVTYKILKAYDYLAQRGSDQIAQKPNGQEIVYDGKFSNAMKLDGCTYTFYKDADLTDMYAEGEKLPTESNSVVYVKESCPTSDHWVTMVSPITIDDVTKYFGSRDDGKTPAATVQKYVSVATTEKGEGVVSVDLTFTSTTTMEAHTPYLVKFDEVGTVMLAKYDEDKASATASESDLVEVTWTDSNVPSVEVTMKGTYDGFTLTPQSSIDDPAYFYFAYNPKYDPDSDSYDETAATGKTPYYFYVVRKNPATINPYRCYFYAVGASGGVNLSMTSFTDGIREVIAEPNALPVALSGVYNLNGQKVREGNLTDGLPTGVYVVNGKKLVVK